VTYTLVGGEGAAQAPSCRRRTDHVTGYMAYQGTLPRVSSRLPLNGDGSGQPSSHHRVLDSAGSKASSCSVRM